MVLPGLINLDYADIRSVMAEMGKAMMGTGEADGEDRAMRAAEAAISNPLLEDTNMKGARGLLINITGGSDITLFEMDQAANRIREEVDEDANIMVGMALDESLAGRMRISVVATGIDSAPPNVLHMPKVHVANGGSVEPVQFPPQATTQNAEAGNAPQALGTGGASQGGAGYIPQPPVRPLLSAAYLAPAGDTDELLLDQPVAPAPRPVAQPTPVRAATPEPARAEPPKRNSLFKSMFGFGGSTPATPPSALARTHQEPVIRQPGVRPQPAMAEAPMPEPEPARANVRQAQVDEIGLEIPAFLRRSQ
jgi:cell division protein FtsZ